MVAFSPFGEGVGREGGREEKGRQCEVGNREVLDVTDCGEMNKAYGDHTIRLLSCNVRGLNNPVKRHKVFTHAKGLQADILFLQETHIKHTARALIKPLWAAQVYQSNSTTKIREVAIIIKKQVPFIHKQPLSDTISDTLLLLGK